MRLSNFLPLVVMGLWQVGTCELHEDRNLARSFLGGLTNKAASIVRSHQAPTARQLGSLDGRHKVGRDTPNTAATSKRQSELSLVDLLLGGGRGANAQGGTRTSQSLESFLAAVQAATRNNTASANSTAAVNATASADVESGETVTAEPATNVEEVAGAEGDAAAEETSAEDIVAVEESEQFSEDAGITVGADGKAKNLGGNLGITLGSDGSTSVGGENGINISPA